MGFLGKIGAALMKFDKGGKGAPMAKGYGEVIGQNSQNADWPLDWNSPDAQSWQYRYLLRARMRDLAETNPYFIKYVEELWANVYGEQGIMLRSKVKETEDRVIHAPDEKWANILYQRRRERVFEWLAEKNTVGVQRALSRARSRMQELKDRGTATVQVGELDVFANKLIEAGWKEWQRAEFCDVRGIRDYGVLRQLRLRDCMTDGGVFILPVKDSGVNKFGFALRQINDEWCDSLYNGEADNGNSIRMGIEWEQRSWGIGKPVAYYFIKRQARDWQRGQMRGAGYSGQSYVQHDRVPADKVIHYTRYKSSDSTRPMPWGGASVQTARQLSEYEKAEVVAARAAACKMGWLYSDTNPEGGEIGATSAQDAARQIMELQPGGFFGLPYGVKFEGFDPNHPNGDYAEFRKGQLRSMCAGLPGANYNIIGNDAEGISYSTGRIFSLDDRELWKLLQRFDIETAERRIFEQWLEMSLITGAIPLPLAKFAKFNKPHFSGRRWTFIDPAKDLIAYRESLLLGLTSRSRMCDELGVDFDDLLFEIAEEEMMIEELGLNALSLTTIASSGASLAAKPDEDEEETEPPTDTEPKPGKNGNGKSRIKLNGSPQAAPANSGTSEN